MHFFVVLVLLVLSSTKAQLEDDVLQDLLDSIYQGEADLEDMRDADPDKMSEIELAVGTSPGILCPPYNDSGVSYDLHTRNPRTAVVLNPEDSEALNKTAFNVTKNTVIYTHGWFQNGEYEASLVVEAYFKHANADINLILTNWGKFSLCKYEFSRWQVIPEVGRVTAQFIQQLVSYGADPKSIHLVGHSFGAQISGYAAKNLDFKLTRISGIDPAGPLFNGEPPANRLDKSDADFVDVMHTNTRYWGIRQPIGHVDFFPNGGETQRGCIGDVCSHGRSIAYYLESIKDPNAFNGVKCDSNIAWNNGKCEGNPLEIMGEHTPPTARGKYYLKTRNSTPFGKKKYGTRP